MKTEWRFSKEATECKAHCMITGTGVRPTSVCFIRPDGSFQWKEYKNRSTALKKIDAFKKKYNAE